MLSVLRGGKAPAYAPQNSGGAPPPARKRRKIGLALGSGVARGWCHIGVLRVFSQIGLMPDVIAGSSIGAVVGGCFAAGQLETLEQFARSLTRRRMLSLIDVSFSSGLIGGAKLRENLERGLAGRDIESLPCLFAAVATELSTGNEIWLRQGALSQAAAASYAIPGLFEPVPLNGRILVDGSLVNPIPVSVCRALGADIVIAVGLVTDSMYRGAIIADRKIEDEPSAQAEALAAASHQFDAEEGWFRRLASPRAFLTHYLRRGPGGGPGIASVMIDAFSIMHDRIARSRLAGEPPDILINARLENFGLFDFHRAAELIALGEETALRRVDELKSLLTTSD